MTSQGPNYSLSFSTDGSNGGLDLWANPTNVAGSADSVYATINLPHDSLSSYLRTFGYSFSVPAGSTIDGILGEALAHADSTLVLITGSGSAPWAVFNDLNTIVGTNSASSWSLGTSDAYLPQGGAADLWGYSGWTPNILNSAAFGIGFPVANSSGSSHTASVDTIRVTVYYTAPPPIAHDEDWPKTTVSQSQKLTWQAVPFRDDEAARGTPPTPFNLEQEDAALIRAQATTWILRPLTASLSEKWFHDEISAQLHNFGRDIDEDCYHGIQLRPWLARDFSQDDPIVHAHNFTRYEDDDYLRRRIGGSWLASPQTDDELGTQLKLFGLDLHDDYSRAVQSLTWLPRPFADDEAKPNAVNIAAFDDHDYSRQRLIGGWSSVAFADDELGTGLLLFGLDQHDDYSRAVQAAPWLPKPASDDEALPGAAFYWTHEDDDFGRAVQAVNWAGVAFRDDEAFGGATDFYSEYEDDYSRAVQARVWYGKSFVADEASGIAADFPLETEDDYRRERQSIAWLAQPFSYDERGPLLKNFGLEIEQHDQPLIRQWFKHQLAIGVAIDEASSYVVIDGSGHRIRAELFMRPRLRAIVG